MKIALLSNGFSESPKEATGITLMELAVFLREEGHDITIISENKKSKRWREDIINGIKVIRFPQVSGVFRRSRNYIWSFIREARKSRYDIIHSFSSSPVLALRSILGGLGSGARTIHTVKSLSRHRGSIWFSSILNFCDAVTVPTKILAKALNEGGCSRKKISVIRSPLRLKMFRPRSRVRLKKKLGYGGKKVILYYGAFFRNKGVHVLAASMQNVVDQVPEAFLILAPRYKGEEIDLIIRMLNEIGLNRHYQVLHGDLRIEELVSLADVVVLPYLDLKGTEGNPSCLLEAAASKTPVVTSDIPEIREIMRKDKDIIMARPGDDVSLAEGIIKVLKDGSFSRCLRENAYRKSLDYSIDRIGAGFLKIYRKS